MAQIAPPSIVIDTSGTAASTVSVPREVNPDLVLSPPSSTKVEVDSCYLCDEQNPGDFSPTTKFLTSCLLCARRFCKIHRAQQWDGVCNINHSRYYHDCLDKAKIQLAQTSPDGISNLDDAEEYLTQEGIYPSLGERDKAIFRTSPVSDATMREIENFRSLDAEIAGTKGRRPSTLIETKDILEADVAV